MKLLTICPEALLQGAKELGIDEESRRRFLHERLDISPTRSGTIDFNLREAENAQQKKAPASRGRK